MGEWAKKDDVTVWWYGKGKDMPKGDTVCTATDITADVHGVQFTCHMGKEKVSVHAPVVGVHQVSNILAAIAGAVSVGMTFSEAAKAASAIIPAHKVLEVIPGKFNLTLIDDTFNNNPEAAKAALDVLAMTKGKHILVFQPMIELGDFATSSHKEVGAHAAKICDAIILTNSNWSQDFIAGVRSVSKSIPISILSGQKAAEYIETFTKTEATVLGKGKESAGVLSLLRK